VVVLIISFVDATSVNVSDADGTSSCMLCHVLSSLHSIDIAGFRFHVTVKGPPFDS